MSVFETVLIIGSGWGVFFVSGGGIMAFKVPKLISGRKGGGGCENNGFIIFLSEGCEGAWLALLSAGSWKAVCIAQVHFEMKRGHSLNPDLAVTEQHSDPDHVTLIDSRLSSPKGANRISPSVVMHHLGTGLNWQVPKSLLRRQEPLATAPPPLPPHADGKVTDQIVNHCQYLLLFMSFFGSEKILCCTPKNR